MDKQRLQELAGVQLNETKMNEQYILDELDNDIKKAILNMQKVIGTDLSEAIGEIELYLNSIHLRDLV